MNDLLDILVDLIAEFALPEPDTSFSIPTADGEIAVLLAWPESKVAIRPGPTPDALPIGDWMIWECHDESSGRVVLRAIADRLQIEPNVLRLDFSRIKGFLEAGQFDSAKEALEKLESQIQSDHPDWAACGRYRREIRIAQRNAGTSETKVKPLAPRVSFPAQVKRDAERVTAPHGQEFNLMGFFSPEDETLSVVDAVWLAQVRDGKICAWTACVQGNPAYEADPNWGPIGTEAEMLDGLLQRLEGKATFV